ncbi:MAG: class I SAM-dependent methyltransferase [Anaerolineales bacterium]|nr:class I SAM-dependent methyltransferase [Anaerolineales bacterium]
MTEKITQAFDASVDYYDDWMRVALPSYAGIFAAALEQIPFEKTASVHVLDLGAGTGLFSWHVLEEYPAATFTLCDLAPGMLEIARQRFTPYPGQFTYLVADYRQISTDQKFDLVISSLSIHHLSDEDKHALFIHIHSLLEEAGLFINIDQVWGPTEYWQSRYWDQWLERVQRSGVSQDQIEASVRRRKEYDREASLADQLQWLEQAGFSQVDCVYKHAFIGVFCALK